MREKLQRFEITIRRVLGSRQDGSRSHSVDALPTGHLRYDMPLFATLLEAGRDIPSDLLRSGLTWYWTTQELVWVDETHTASTMIERRGLTGLTEESKVDLAADLARKYVDQYGVLMEVYRGNPSDLDTAVQKGEFEAARTAFWAGEPSPIHIVVAGGQEDEEQTVRIDLNVNEALLRLLEEWNIRPTNTTSISQRKT